ncbi:acyl carrier protein [Pelagibacteraceae bacterium]|jgi:acyl carrier protein|nr:acyl carrier protein [Pelagibacteraceae bacterium]|tara:strand:- start:226 stop:462 length:237 start_codon:yes stop_codon:yes gene_type:complete
MDNKKKYKEVFIESLAINSEAFNEDIKYNDIPEWDSIGHMTLMSGLEDAFKISLETDDVIEFSSYKVGVDILKKYKVF